MVLAKITDIPDDCGLTVLHWLSIADIISLRMTCKRMADLTGLRSLWHAVYQRLLKTVPMLPLQTETYSGSLDNVPAQVLERICVSAYRLQLALDRLIPSPSLVSSIRPPLNIESESRHGPISELLLSPGGRFLVQVSPDLWRVVVWDLQDLRADESGQGRDILNKSVSGRDVASSSPPSCAVTSWDGRVHVFLHGTILQHDASLSYRTVTYVVSLQVPSTQDKVHRDAAGNSTRIRRLPGIPGLSNETSSIDINGSLMSFLVEDVEDSDITRYVIDWTFEDKENKDILRGIALCSSGADEPLPRGYTGTRVLQGKEHNYLACVTSDGMVMLYLVPPLSVVKAGNLPRVQVAPIAWKSIPHLPTRGVSAWSPGVPGDSGVLGVQTYTLTIRSGNSAYKVLFTPSRISQDPTHSYENTYILSPSTLNIEQMRLPISHQSRLMLCAFGPSGTRFACIEQSMHAAKSELVILVKTHQFDVSMPPPPLSSSASHAVRDQSTHEDEFGEGRSRDGEKALSRRMVLSGLISTLARNVDKMAFDEGSGRMCLGTGKGMITVIDFAPTKQIVDKGSS